jgi:hypothetical protein
MASMSAWKFLLSFLVMVVGTLGAVPPRVHGRNHSLRVRVGFGLEETHGALHASRIALPLQVLPPDPGSTPPSGFPNSSGLIFPDSVSLETMGSGVPADFDSRLGSFLPRASARMLQKSFSPVWYAFPRASAEMMHILDSPIVHNLSRATAGMLSNFISPFTRHFPCASAKLLSVLHSPLRHHLLRATAEVLPNFYSQLVHVAARVSSGVTHFVCGRVAHSTPRALSVMLPFLSIGLAHVVPPAFGAMPAGQNLSSLNVSSYPTLRPMPRELDSCHDICTPPVPSVMPHVAHVPFHGISRMVPVTIHANVISSSYMCAPFTSCMCTTHDPADKYITHVLRLLDELDCGGVIVILVGDEWVVGPSGLATGSIAKCWVGRRASMNVVPFTSGLTPVLIASVKWLEVLCSFSASSLPISTSAYADCGKGSSYRHFVSMYEAHHLIGLPMVGNPHFYLAFETTPNGIAMTSSTHLLNHPLLVQSRPTAHQPLVPRVLKMFVHPPLPHRTISCPFQQLVSAPQQGSSVLQPAGMEWGLNCKLEDLKVHASRGVAYLTHAVSIFDVSGSIRKPCMSAVHSNQFHCIWVTSDPSTALFSQQTQLQSYTCQPPRGSFTFHSQEQAYLSHPVAIFDVFDGSEKLCMSAFQSHQSHCIWTSFASCTALLCQQTPAQICQFLQHRVADSIQVSSCPSRRVTDHGLVTCEINSCCERAVVDSGSAFASPGHAPSSTSTRPHPKGRTSKVPPPIPASAASPPSPSCLASLGRRECPVASVCDNRHHCDPARVVRHTGNGTGIHHRVPNLIVLDKPLPVPLRHIGQGLPATVEGCMLPGNTDTAHLGSEYYNGILVFTSGVTPVTMWRAGSGLPSATAPSLVNPGVLMDDLAAPARAEAPAPCIPISNSHSHTYLVCRGLGPAVPYSGSKGRGSGIPLTVGPDVYAPGMNKKTLALHVISALFPKMGGVESLLFWLRCGEWREVGERAWFGVVRIALAPVRILSALSLAHLTIPCFAVAITILWGITTWVALCHGFLHIDELRAKAVRAWYFTPVTFTDNDTSIDPLISLPFRTRVFHRLAIHGRWSKGTKLVYAFVRPTKQRKAEFNEIAREFAEAFATLVPPHITRRNHIIRRLVGTIVVFALSMALASVLGSLRPSISFTHLATKRCPFVLITRVMHSTASTLRIIGLSVVSHILHPFIHHTCMVMSSVIPAFTHVMPQVIDAIIAAPVVVMQYLSPCEFLKHVPGAASTHHFACLEGPARLHGVAEGCFYLWGAVISAMRARGISALGHVLVSVKALFLAPRVGFYGAFTPRSIIDEGGVGDGEFLPVLHELREGPGHGKVVASGAGFLQVCHCISLLLAVSFHVRPWVCRCAHSGASMGASKAMKVTHDTASHLAALGIRLVRLVLAVLYVVVFVLIMHTSCQGWLAMYPHPILALMHTMFTVVLSIGLLCVVVASQQPAGFQTFVRSLLNVCLNLWYQICLLALVTCVAHFEFHAKFDTSLPVTIARNPSVIVVAFIVIIINLWLIYKSFQPSIINPEIPKDDGIKPVISHSGSAPSTCSGMSEDRPTGIQNSVPACGGVNPPTCCNTHCDQVTQNCVVKPTRDTAIHVGSSTSCNDQSASVTAAVHGAHACRCPAVSVCSEHECIRVEPDMYFDCVDDADVDSATGTHLSMGDNQSADMSDNMRNDVHLAPGCAAECVQECAGGVPNVRSDSGRHPAKLGFAPACRICRTNSYSALWQVAVAALLALALNAVPGLAQPLRASDCATCIVCFPHFVSRHWAACGE